MCVCVCARQSPLTCPEASFPNLHGTVIAKFKQWSRGQLHHTIPADRADWMGRVQRNQSFAYIATRIRTPSESGKELQASKARRGNQEKARQAREGRPRRGFDGTQVRCTRSRAYQPTGSIEDLKFKNLVDRSGKCRHKQVMRDICSENIILQMLKDCIRC